MENNKLVVTEKQSSLFNSLEMFETGQRMAKTLVSSELVPQQFRLVPKEIQDIRNRTKGNEQQYALQLESYRGGKMANAVIALEMAQRLGASPLAVMQNMYIVHGKPSWSASFIIAAINSCGRFLPLRFEITGEGDDRTCIAWTKEIDGDERLESPPVSIGMAKKEGWYGKNGSKWQTMPELMLRYRSATFFGRLYAPEILMGMRSTEELKDTPPEDPVMGETVKTTVEDLNKRFPGKEVIDEETGEISGNEQQVGEPAVNDQAGKEEQQQETPEEKPPQVRPRPAKVASFKAEIDEKLTDQEINTWAEKHWKRVERECPHPNDQEEIRRYANERIESFRATEQPEEEVASQDSENQPEQQESPERSPKFETYKNALDSMLSALSIDQWCMNMQETLLRELTNDEVDEIYAYAESRRESIKANQ